MQDSLRLQSVRETAEDSEIRLEHHQIHQLQSGLTNQLADALTPARGNIICTAGFPSAAVASSCLIAGYAPIWYGFFIATLLFSAKENCF
jgi:hypothetical protein